MESIKYEPIIPSDYSILTRIMTSAFNEDTRMHTELKEDGPSGYSDGSLIRKLNTNPKYSTMKIIYQNMIIGGYTIYKDSNNIFYLEMLFIEPNYQNKYLGAKVWKHIEITYYNAKKWVVETPDYSKRNHYFYTEKCGFKFYKEKLYKNGAKSYIFEKIASINSKI